MPTYRGSCHCGAVTFAADLELTDLARCNCSRCRRLGIVMKGVPADAFTLEGGEDALVTYRFNTRTIAHLFCRHCGIESFARGADPSGQEMVMVNVNCLEDADYDPGAVSLFDGRSF